MERTTKTLSRERWESHPSYPSQTLLLGSHDHFLAINDDLIDQARRLPDPDRLRARYRYWILAMRSHERYEELKLYPYLEHRFGECFERSLQGHQALHEKHASVLSAFAQVAADPKRNRESLLRALEEHRATLYEHLQIEEAAVIPRLLEMSREEFRRYYALPLDRLLHADAG